MVKTGAVHKVLWNKGADRLESCVASCGAWKASCLTGPSTSVEAACIGLRLRAGNNQIEALRLALEPDGLYHACQGSKHVGMGSQNAFFWTLEGQNRYLNRWGSVQGEFHDMRLGERYSRELNEADNFASHRMSYKGTIHGATFCQESIFYFQLSFKSVVLVHCEDGGHLPRKMILSDLIGLFWYGGPSIV